MRYAYSLAQLAAGYYVMFATTGVALTLIGLALCFMAGWNFGIAQEEAAS